MQTSITHTYNALSFIKYLHTYIFMYFNLHNAQLWVWITLLYNSSNNTNNISTDSSVFYVFFCLDKTLNSFIILINKFKLRSFDYVKYFLWLFQVVCSQYTLFFFKCSNINWILLQFNYKFLLFVYILLYKMSSWGK